MSIKKLNILEDNRLTDSMINDLLEARRSQKKVKNDDILKAQEKLLNELLYGSKRKKRKEKINKILWVINI